MRRGREIGRGRVHAAHRAQPFHQRPVQEGGCDEVEHDRCDHNMAAALGLQNRRNVSPCRAKGGGTNHRAQQRQRPMRPRDEQADDGHAKPAQTRLPLAADIEQRRVIGDGHGQPGEDEVGGVIQRKAPAIAGPHRPGHHGLQRFPRAFPDGEDHQRGNRCRQQKRDQRRQDHIRPFWHLVHQMISGAGRCIRMLRTSLAADSLVSNTLRSNA